MNKERIRMMIKIAVMAIGILLILLSVPPILKGITHIGVMIPLAAGMASVLLGIFDGRLCRTITWWPAASRVLSLFLLIGIVIFGVMSGILAFGFQKYQPAANREETVVVLGCKVKGDKPSKMLRYRLEKAYEILRKNPKANCVVSGGQGEDELFAESQVMADYLIGKGIERSRIYQENQSESTAENLKFSLKIIREKGLSEQVVTVTDFYHQYRANYYAKKEGAEVSGAACYTNPLLVFSYWAREILAVWKGWVLGV